jgi:hypothetical protein
VRDADHRPFHDQRDAQQRLEAFSRRIGLRMSARSTFSI